MHVPPALAASGHWTIIHGPKRGSRRLKPLGVDQEVAAPEPSIITRMAYGVSQLPRVVWYLGHGLALRRLAEAARRDNGAKARRRIRTSAPVPDRARLYADMARLFLQDLANIEARVSCSSLIVSSMVVRDLDPCRVHRKGCNQMTSSNDLLGEISSSSPRCLGLFEL